MTVYPRRRVHIVPGHPRRLRRPGKAKHQEEKTMQMLVATMKCGRTKYEARLPIPGGATRDPSSLNRIKTQLRLMLAEQVVKGAEVTFKAEKMAALR